MLKAVIFDMDGVIVDSEPMHAKANEIALKAFGLDRPADYYLGFAGTSKLTMMNIIIKEHGLNATADELIKAADEQNDIISNSEGFIQVNGACDLIKRLHAEGLILGLASSSPYYDIEKVLNYFRIYPYFDKIVSGFGEHFKPKPAPDIYINTLKEMELSADEAIAVEDTDYGIQAATSAGLKCIGYHNPNSGNQTLALSSDIIKNYNNVNSNYFKSILQGE